MKVIFLITGKKQSGKNTLANLLAALLCNELHPKYHASVDDLGRLRLRLHQPVRQSQIGETGEIIDIAPGSSAVSDFPASNTIAIQSFADPLKMFCRDVLGLSHKQCYGTDADKNTITGIDWDGFSREVRRKYAKGRAWYKPWTWTRLRGGPMTAREVLQVFGTDVVRAIYSDAWASAGIKAAVNSPQVAVVLADTRFPNELARGIEEGDENPHTQVFTIRLKRNLFPNDKHPSETALDHVSDNRFRWVIPEHATIEDLRVFVENVVHPELVKLGVIPHRRSAAA